jgi:competence ComEA-like helix-hairpin-helix protein
MLKYFAALLMVAAVAPCLIAQDPQLPEGEGKAAVLKICVGCHEIGDTTGSRRTELGWQQSVAEMVDRGAEGSDDELAAIIAYLTKYFGKLNVNTASPAQLQDFLGLSEKEAQAIVAYREHEGRIKDFEQLKSVPGANSEKLQAKRALIAFNL